MKTRLLKKVRKRYTITKVNEVGINASKEYQTIEEIYDLPFYRLDDTKYSNGYFPKYSFFKTFDEAIKKLNCWIIIDYGKQFKRECPSKVWWVNKNK
jgi:hypothetical protein